MNDLRKNGAGLGEIDDFIERHQDPEEDRAVLRLPAWAARSGVGRSFFGDL